MLPIWPCLSLNSALHKLILHVHVRCWDFTILRVSALGATLEDMGKMYQSPTLKKTRRISWAPCYFTRNAPRHWRFHAYGSRTRRNHGGIWLTRVCSVVVRYQAIYSYHSGLTLWAYGNHKTQGQWSNLEQYGHKSHIEQHLWSN